MDMFEHLRRQAAFSRATFGPGPRTKGVLDHVGKEIEEVRTAVGPAERSKEWTDIAILGLDGLLRSCREQIESAGDEKATNSRVAKMACRLIKEKQDANEVRDWPDWRTSDPEKAIEHVREEHKIA